MTESVPEQPIDASAIPQERLGALLNAKETVERCFPKGWQCVEACLSVVATLLLEDAQDPVALILQGPPASLKTTILSFFPSALDVVYRSDKFTPASFVSHHASARKQRLEGIDLLPRIRHKALVTPELAPLFRGGEEALTSTFSVLTRVLDGQGLITDSGVHGQRGYEGDYNFVWLGATTPLPSSTWRVMAQLGSRLFFMPVPEGEATNDELEEIISGTESYANKVSDCTSAVSAVVMGLLPSPEAVRSVKWERGMMPEEVSLLLMRLSRLLARLRGVVPILGREGGNRPELSSPVVEHPHRILNVFLNVARGHALLYGRDYLTEADIALLVPIALGSCPDHRRTLFKAILKHNGSLTAEQGSRALRVGKETARTYLEELERLDLVTMAQNSQSQVFQLAEGWQWLLEQDLSDWNK